MIKKIYLQIILFLIVLTLWEPGVSNLFAEKNKDIELADKKYNQAILLMNSDATLAMNELNSAKKLNPEDPKIFVAIGQVHFRQNNLQKAIKAFEKAIKLNKNYVVAYSNMGYTYMRLKNWDEAINNFRIILNYPSITAPHFVHNAIGWAYYEKNEFKKSIKELKKAIKLKNNYAIAHYNLGLSLLGLGNFDQALNEFKDAIQYQPNLVQAHNHLALLFLKKNMKKKAREKFQEVIEFDPKGSLAEEAKNYLNIINR